MWKRGCAIALSLSLGAVSGLPAFADKGATPPNGKGGVTFAADTTVFDRNVRVVGGLAVDGTVTCKVLTILGGMDVAEPIVVAPENAAAIAPGMVLSIDPEHPGALMLASEPYDQKVAGVVSGANGIAPGLQLHTETLDASPHLLAMVGRIYVRATMETPDGHRYTRGENLVLLAGPSREAVPVRRVRPDGKGGEVVEYDGAPAHAGAAHR